MPGAPDALDPDQVDGWSSDAVPRPERGRRLLVEEATGGHQVPARLVSWFEGRRVFRKRRRLTPARLQEADAGELAPGRRILWTQVCGRQQARLGGRDLARASKIHHVLNQRAARAGRGRHLRRGSFGRRFSRRGSIVAGQHQQCPASRRRPGAIEFSRRHQLEGRVRRVMSDYPIAHPADDNDVVVAVRTDLDQGHDRAAAIDLLSNPLAGSAGGGVVGKGLPPSAPHVGGQRLGADARCAAIDQGQEILGLYLAIAPVAQHHGHGSATT